MEGFDLSSSRILARRAPASFNSQNPKPVRPNGQIIERREGSPKEMDSLPFHLPLLPIYTHPLIPHSQLLFSKLKSGTKPGPNNPKNPFMPATAASTSPLTFLFPLLGPVRPFIGDVFVSSGLPLTLSNELGISKDISNPQILQRVPAPIFDDAMVDSLHDLIKNDIFQVAISFASLRRSQDSQYRAEVSTVGVLASLQLIPQTPDSPLQVSITSISRISLKLSDQTIQAGNATLRVVSALHLPSLPYVSEEYKTDLTLLLNKLNAVMKMGHPIINESFVRKVLVEKDPGDIADLCAGCCFVSGLILQQSILEERNIIKRLKNTTVLLHREIEFLKFVERMQNPQRTPESNPTRRTQPSYLEHFTERLEQIKLPLEVRRVVDEEMNKLKSLSPTNNSNEHYTCRNYLKWILDLPWGIYSQDVLDIRTVSQILDEDHFGLEDVKQRILEFVAVAQLNGSLSGKIICLVGPPGVGKTSVGKSIARAINRKFYRFSVGGMSDVAEIKGHRRTYIGALPGKLIHALNSCQTSNPVLLIDEIDKISKSYNGDPSSALLEVLDPEQNKSFVDHYLDLPFDLSKVLFICTANNLSTIPRPLLDRMEIIKLSGYFMDEKLAIAKNYIIPKLRTETHLSDSQLVFEEGVLKAVIDMYCREPGVRSLEKELEKIFRKAALLIAKGDSSSVSLSLSNLSQFLGKARFLSDKMYEQTPPGVVIGLAWSPMGGSLIWIETVCVQDGGKPNLKITGKLGDVMQESTAIAFTFAKKLLQTVDPLNSFFSTANLHIHFPEGAIPKDGPSAGCAIVTSFLSLALNKSVPSHVAMTGEISLTGKVLAVGGIKEKVMAAQRSGITLLFLPHENQRDFNDLSSSLTKDFTVHFVQHYMQIFDTLFGSVLQIKSNL